MNLLRNWVDGALRFSEYTATFDNFELALQCNVGLRDYLLERKCNDMRV
jgi:hypothetical protein